MAKAVLIPAMDHLVRLNRLARDEQAAIIRLRNNGQSWAAGSGSQFSAGDGTYYGSQGAYDSSQPLKYSQ